MMCLEQGDKMNTLRILFSIFVMSLIYPTSVYAGEEWSELSVKNEISYLAKKLLDMSGKDAYTVEYEAYDKPYIGICSEVNVEGVAITCITPGSQADKAGLKTGDTVSEINGINMRHKDVMKTKKAYMHIVKSMKKGDVIAMKLNRAGKINEVKVTVGSMSHPAYKLEIKR